MISVLIACCFGIVSQSHDQISLTTTVASVSREELRLIGRMQSLRIITEKLPENWKAAGIKSMPQGSVLTKQVLLREMEDEELKAAERWNIILENTALLDKATDASDLRAAKFRKSLEDLPRIHQELNQKLDQFNLKLKDGILQNLASKFLPT
jgi:hypothetical protein